MNRNLLTLLVALVASRSARRINPEVMEAAVASMLYG